MTKHVTYLLFSVLLCAGPQSSVHAQDGIKALSTVRQKSAAGATGNLESSAAGQQDLIKKKREIRKETSAGNPGSGTYRVCPSCVQK